MATGKYRSRRSAALAQTYTVTDTATNTVTDVLTLRHFTSGTAAAGYGTGILFVGEDASGNTDNLISIDAVLATATAGAEVTDFEVHARNAGAALATLARFKGNALSVAATPFLFDQTGLTIVGGLSWNGSANRVVGHGPTTDCTGLNFSNATLDLAVSARNSLYLNIDSNNDTTTAVMYVACNRASSSGGTILFEVNELSSVVCGSLAAIATTATDGFLYIPTCAGTPTGTPTAKTGKVPLVWDTTNKKFYIYDGSWLGGTTPGAFV